MNLRSGLYIVSTPIGNLFDITLRALETLKKSNIILCEDTRVSGKLLAKHNIKSSLKVYNDKSDESLRSFVKELILQGKIVSLISDAGTPLISDPGYKLIRYLKEENIHIDVIPGACALIAALTLSSLPTDKFFFHGFLPKTKDSKEKIFQKLSSVEATLIFYETANRLLSSLEIALKILGNRRANIARELTKLYQESNLANLSELIEYYRNIPPKGEIVITIAGKGDEEISESQIKEEISNLLSQGLTAKTTADEIFHKYQKQFSRKYIYKIVNQLKLLI